MSSLSSVNPVFTWCQADNHGFCPGTINQSSATEFGNIVRTNTCLCGCHDYDEALDADPVEASIEERAAQDDLFAAWLAKYHPNIRVVRYYDAEPLTGEFYD